MIRTVILYGGSLALLVFILKLVEYRFLAKDLTLEFYIGAVAVLFTTLGVWAGLRITKRKAVAVTNEGSTFNEEEFRKTGLSKREHEVLALMAGGLSNQEIADRLFLSLNTVKTHISNVFLKLDVRRRTQAIQKAKRLRLIP